MSFFSSNQEYVGNEGENFFFLTNFGAPKHHLIEVNIRNHIDMWNADIVVPVRFACDSKTISGLMKICEIIGRP